MTKSLGRMSTLCAGLVLALSSLSAQAGPAVGRGGGGGKGRLSGGSRGGGVIRPTLPVILDAAVRTIEVPFAFQPKPWLYHATLKHVMVKAFLPEEALFTEIFGEPYTKIYAEEVTAANRALLGLAREGKQGTSVAVEIARTPDTLAFEPSSKEGEINILIAHSVEGETGRVVPISGANAISVEQIHRQALEGGAPCIVITCYSSDLLINRNIDILEAVSLVRDTLKTLGETATLQDLKHALQDRLAGDTDVAPGIASLKVTYLESSLGQVHLVEISRAKDSEWPFWTILGLTVFGGVVGVQSFRKKAAENRDRQVILAQLARAEAEYEASPRRGSIKQYMEALFRCTDFEMAHSPEQARQHIATARICAMQHSDAYPLLLVQVLMQTACLEVRMGNHNLAVDALGKAAAQARDQLHRDPNNAWAQLILAHTLSQSAAGDSPLSSGGSLISNLEEARGLAARVAREIATRAVVGCPDDSLLHKEALLLIAKIDSVTFSIALKGALDVHDAYGRVCESMRQEREVMAGAASESKHHAAWRARKRAIDDLYQLFTAPT